ncbi:MAG: DUF2283 domain-containing protein [Bdellovibrio sp.]
MQKAARIFALEKYIENVEEIVRLMQLDQAIGRSRPIGRRFMKVDKDVKLDVGYIHIRKGRVTKTVDLSPGILFDFNKKSEVLGIELLSLERLAPPLFFEKPRRKQSRKAAW